MIGKVRLLRTNQLRQARTADSESEGEVSKQAKPVKLTANQQLAKIREVIGPLRASDDMPEEVMRLAIDRDNLREQNGVLLLKLSQATSEKPKGSEYLSALCAQYAKQERLPDYYGTWNELVCKCGARMLYNNGDTRDVTAMDVDAVKCWQCGEAKFLGDIKDAPEDWQEWCVETYPRPTRPEGSKPNER
jgi:hypothetical protein